MNRHAGNHSGRSIAKIAALVLLLALAGALPAAAAPGDIVTTAGTGTTGFSGDSGLATSASVSYPSGVTSDLAGNLYIADSGNNRIRKVDTSGVITTIAGTGVDGYFGDNGPATSANLSYPISVSFDANGNLYIADFGNNRIRKIDTAGTITTVAGTGLAGFSGDGYAATLAQLDSPSDVYAAPGGVLYIADYFNHRIRKVDAGGTITTVAGDGYTDAVTGNGRYNGDNIPATSASLNYPAGVTLDAVGNIYIADELNNRIRMVVEGGNITTVAGDGYTDANGDGRYNGDGIAATTASLNFPASVSFDPDGFLYIADQYNHRIRKVVLGGNISTVAGDGYTDANGNGRYNGDGILATSASLNGPTGVFVDSGYSIQIADQSNHRTRRVLDGVKPTGSIMINFGSPYTITTEVTLYLSCVDLGGPCKKMQVSNNGIDWTLFDYADVQAWSLTPGDGLKTVSAQFQDSAGNWSDTYPAAITLDATPPNTTLTGAPELLTNSTSATFTFSASEPSTFECQIDFGAFLPCASGKTYTVALGDHTVSVRAVDLAHNPDPSPASHTWTVTAATLQHLTVAKHGRGTVTSNPAGIDCGYFCSANYYDGAGPVVLSATPDPGWNFVGWTGDPDCADGSLTMNGAKSCKALFAAPAKIGVFQNGYWYLDANQSWDWNGTPPDILGVFGVGLTGAVPVVGDWNGDGKTKIGVFIDGVWYLDMNNNWQWDGEGTDVRGVFGVGVPNAVPVTGDWNGDGITKIGIYSDGIWYLDMNNNWAWDGEGVDVRGVFGVGVPNAKPVIGDWTGDGIAKIGIYSDGKWYLDKNKNWVWDDTPTDVFGIFGVGLSNVIPVTGDWNGDGITKIGVYSDGNWYLDTNNNWQWDGMPADTFGVFGVGLGTVYPVTGNW
ncbi:MAG: hypothetical protein M0042_12865 [Nitrospiraceae bacterium]|nr:hypothetical protein [Nitrospiraceae bacterium]